MINSILKHKQILIYCLLILGIFLPRIIYLNADTVPIVELHNEDEGNYVYNVRNYVVEGTFIKDQTNFIFLSPVFSALIYPVIKTFGIHIYSFRLINALTSTLTVIIGYIFLSKEFSKRAGYFFVLLLGTDFLYLIHNRIAMPETTASFFMLTSLIAIYYAAKNNKVYLYALSGFIAALAYLTKSSAIIIVGVALLSISVYMVQLFFQKKLTKEKTFSYVFFIFIFLTSFMVPVSVYYFLITKNYPELFDIVYKNLIAYHRPYIRTHLLTIRYHREEIKEFIQGGEGFIWKYLTPYIIALAFGLKSLLKDNKNKIFIIWLTLGLSYFYILWYKPARWFVPNLIPLIALCSILISQYPKKIGSLILSFILFYNVTLSYKYIYANPTFYLLNASNRIEEIAKEETVTGDSLILLDNSYSKAYNDYFLEREFKRDEIEFFLKSKNYPKYFIKGGNAYNYFFDINTDYVGLEQMDSSQLGRNIIVYEYK